jgi:hypothetical protein
MTHLCEDLFPLISGTMCACLRVCRLSCVRSVPCKFTVCRCAVPLSAQDMFVANCVWCVCLSCGDQRTVAFLEFRLTGCLLAGQWLDVDSRAPAKHGRSTVQLRLVFLLCLVRTFVPANFWNNVCACLRVCVSPLLCEDLFPVSLTCVCVLQDMFVANCVCVIVLHWPLLSVCVLCVRVCVCCVCHRFLRDQSAYVQPSSGRKRNVQT